MQSPTVEGQIQGIGVFAGAGRACLGRSCRLDLAARHIIHLDPGVSPQITVTVSGDRYGVETEVADNGNGVADAYRTQIFRPLFTTKPRGSGLGLSSARAIVEWHGGTIGFQPHAQRGSRFWFRGLPASHA